MSPITIFAVAILVRAYTVTQIPTQGTTSPACIELVNRPTYPNLARIAKIQGTVRVHLVIAPDGVSTEFTRDSHSLLVREVTASLQGTEFPAVCYGSHDFNFKFVLEGAADEAHTSFIINPPDEYVVKSNFNESLGVVYSQVRRESWIRRLLSKF